MELEEDKALFVIPPFGVCVSEFKRTRTVIQKAHRFRYRSYTFSHVCSCAALMCSSRGLQYIISALCVLMCCYSMTSTLLFHVLLSCVTVVCHALLSCVTISRVVLMCCSRDAISCAALMCLASCVALTCYSFIRYSHVLPFHMLLYVLLSSAMRRSHVLLSWNTCVAFICCSRVLQTYWALSSLLPCVALLIAHK